MKKIIKFLLVICLKFSNFLYKLISYLSIKYEGDIHPKHRLLNYHQFFLDNIKETDSVLDIGCGNGALSYDVAQIAKKVVGVDIVAKNIEFAKRKHQHNNLSYIVADATKDLRQEKYDVIILSNVLEHIENRPAFLKSIRGLANKYLIRVPMFNRDWIPLYKKELGIESRLDLTHFIEFTEPVFRKELTDAGFKIDALSVQFGEIWSVLSKND